MAWEWVPPVVTGVVGVAGVGGTLLGAHLTRRSSERQAAAALDQSREQRSRDEKREVYVAFLQAMARARGEPDEIKRLAALEPLPMQEMVAAKSRAQADLRVTREHLRLVAPPIVRGAALNVQNQIVGALNLARRGEPASYNHLAARQVLVAMKADLNYELTRVDQERYQRLVADQARADDVA